MGTVAPQITSHTIVYSTVYSRCRPKKTSKLRVTSLCAGNSPVTALFPTQRASNAKMFPFDDVIMMPPQCIYMTRVYSIIQNTLTLIMFPPGVKGFMTSCILTSFGIFIGMVTNVGRNSRGFMNSGCHVLEVPWETFLCWIIWLLPQRSSSMSYFTTWKATSHD